MKLSDLEFSPESALCTPDHLTRLLRVMMIRDGITEEKFGRIHDAFWQRHGIHTPQGQKPRGKSISKSNFSKSLHSDEVTWNTFKKLVNFMLKKNVVRYIVECVDENGNVTTYSSTDDLKDILEKKPDPVGHINPPPGYL